MTEVEESAVKCDSPFSFKDTNESKQIISSSPVIVTQERYCSDTLLVNESLGKLVNELPVPEGLEAIGEDTHVTTTPPATDVRGSNSTKVKS